MVSNNCTGRGIDRMAVVLDANIEVEVGLIGIFLMLVTLAPHLISTLYSFAAVSNISVIEDDLNQRKLVYTLNVLLQIFIKIINGIK